MSCITSGHQTPPVELATFYLEGLLLPNTTQTEQPVQTDIQKRTLQNETSYSSTLMMNLSIDVKKRFFNFFIFDTFLVFKVFNF